ncbi:MAG: hypothetical protein HYS13_06460 [Planctomycetia bacterium]|nr:hypothetical protein [Planctomycetia bacterium]
MQSHGRMGAILVLVAAALSLHVVARADDLGYNDLRRRIEDLERSQGLAGVGGDNCCDDCCCQDAFYAVYENVIVEPHFTHDPAFYVQGPGDVFAERSFDWDLEYSPRVEFGRVTDCGMGWRARWWNFDHTTAQSATGVDAQASFSGGDDNTTVELDFVGNIAATHRLEVDVIDVEATVMSGNALFSAGVRYARMDQVYFAQQVGTTNFIRAAHDFEGFGPTVGVDVLAPLSNSDLAGFVKVRGSLLYGESLFRANDETTAVLLRSLDNDLIGIAEIQLGVDWRRCLDNGSTFFVTVALEAQLWTNAGTGLPGRVGTDDGNYQNEGAQEADMGFFGFNIGTGLVW